MTPREQRWEKLMHGTPMKSADLRKVMSALRTMPPLDLASTEAHGRSGGTALAVSQRARGVDTYKALKQLHRKGEVNQLLTRSDVIYYL